MIGWISKTIYNSRLQENHVMVFKGVIVMNFKEEKIVPFTNYRYRVNEAGSITDVDGEVLDTVIVNGERVVKFSWIDGDIYYELGLVVVVTVFNIQLPSTLFSKIEVMYSDGNKQNTLPSNLFYRFKGSPLPVADMSGFFYIPYYTSYAVNIDGVVLNLRTGRSVTWCPTKSPNSSKNITGGYFVGWSRKDIRGSKVISRHRAIGLTFLKYPSDPEKLVINHKNGRPELRISGD